MHSSSFPWSFIRHALVPCHFNITVLIFIKRVVWLVDNMQRFLRVVTRSPDKYGTKVCLSYVINYCRHYVDSRRTACK